VIVYDNPQGTRQDRFYGKDIPSAGHGGWVDGLGEMVRTDKFPDFQSALKRMHPDAELVFDRVDGWWTVILWGRVPVECCSWVGGENLWTLKNVPGTLLALRTHVPVMIDKGWKDHYTFRVPDEVALNTLAAMKPGEISFDNVEYANDVYTANAELRWKNQERERHQKVSELVQEAAPHVTRSGDDKVFSTVGVESSSGSRRPRMGSRKRKGLFV
jgi:hypothetical protein